MFRFGLMIRCLGVACAAGSAAAVGQTSMPAVVVYTKDNAPATPELDALPLRASVSQYGITWTFDRPARVGQFVNGDFYVVGPVTVAVIDPAPRYGNDVADGELDKYERGVATGDRARNGSMLNVPAKREVAWDSGIRNFYSAQWAAKVPIDMQPGDCLASSISLRNGEEPAPFPYHSAGARAHGDDDNCPTKVAALLTCVAGPLPPDALRPGYCGHDPTIHLTRNLCRERLPHLARVAGEPDPLKFADVLQKPWLDTGFFSFDQPMENMPHYGQWVGQAVSDAALLLASDFQPEEKERLLINLIEIGIDHYSAIRQGHPGWWAWGGFGSGRKFPIVFAGTLLGDDAMANVSRSFPKASFGEDEMTSYGKCWTGARVVFCGHSGIDTATGIGRNFGERGRPWGPYEHLPPSQWNAEQHRSEAYRRANTSCCWVGEALVAHLMKLEKAWGHDAFFDYVDRWMNESDEASCLEIVKYFPDANLTDPAKDWCHQGYTGDEWVKPMWTNYRSLASAPQNGWKRRHDESYYINAVAKQKNEK
jgi:hypothetical protein